MATAQAINVDRLIDEKRFDGFNIRVVALALLALIADGYDVQVMSFAASSLMQEWGLQRSDFGPVFSASLFGILFGAPLFGWLGDRIGRKRCIVLASLLYGAFCLACLLARDLQTLVVLRFLTGVGLGGVMPNAIAIAAELSPRRQRAMMASVIAIGITIGGVLPGPVAAASPHEDAWRILFLIGGVAPIVIAGLVWIGMPESVGFLVRRKAPRKRIERLLREIDPRLQVDETTAFEIDTPAVAEKPGMAALFQGPLRLVTPLLWLMFASTLLTLYLLNSWLPLLLEAGGLPRARAAWVSTMFHVGGVLGVLGVSTLLGRLGAKLVASLFALTWIAIAVVARVPLGEFGLAVGVFICGVGLIGTQATLNGTAGLAYPTSARSKGVGMALGVGRIGSVVGPLIGAAMVQAGNESTRDLFLLPLAPLAMGLVATLIVMRLLKSAGAAGTGAGAR